MWTSMLDLDPKRVLITQLLMRIWPGACFSSFAPLQVQNIPRQPLPETTWVRVRNRLAGICGSDLHLIQGDGDFRIAPAALATHNHSYPGHEVIGEVLEVGEDVQRLHVGDRVALQYTPNCLSTRVQSPCRSCAQGYYNLCENGNLPGPQPIGGGWSEEMLLPEQQLFCLPNDINDEQAVLLEPTAVALHAVLQRLPQKNERVLIIGAGTIGLLTLQIIRALAPQADISVLARHSFQIEQATRMGAKYIIYPQDSYTGIQRATDAQLYKGSFDNKMLLGGYDVIFDTVGNQKTLHHALRWARMQATIVLVGINLHQMNIDLTPIWYQEVKLIGSMGSSIETWPPAQQKRPTFDIAVELMRHMQIHPEYLITHRFPLNNYKTALSTAASKLQNHAIKVVFDYSLLPPSVVPNVRASATHKRKSIQPDEKPSMSEDQITAEKILPPVRSAEPSIPVSLSTLFSASHTVAPPAYEDDELDEMEDTLSAPIIIKPLKQASATQQEEMLLTSEEDKTVQPVSSIPPVPLLTPSSNNEVTFPPLIEQNKPQEGPLSPEEETHPVALIGPTDETTTSTDEEEAYPIVLIGPTDETTAPTDETAKIDVVSASVPFDESITENVPLVSKDQTIAPTNERAEIDEISTSISSEASVDKNVTIVAEDETEEPADERAEIDEIPSEVSIDKNATIMETEMYTLGTPEYDNETFGATEYFDETFDTPEYFDEVLAIDQDSTSYMEESFESETRTMQPTYEASETTMDSDNLFTLNSHDPSSLPDPNQEEENHTSNATEGTENTLLHKESQQTTKIQNRTRARTRKKNSRISLEKQ